MGLFRIDASEMEACRRTLRQAAERGDREVPAEVLAVVERLRHGPELGAQLNKLMIAGNADKAVKLLGAHDGSKGGAAESGFALLFAIPFIGGGVWMLGEGNKLAEVAEASVDWPSVVGTIRSGEIEKHVSTSTRSTKHGGSTTSSSTSWRVDITYDYVVGGEELTGATIAYRNQGHFEGDDYKISFDEREDAEAVLARYPVGAQVDVHYDPGRPRVSVLEPGAETINWWRVMGILFIGAGIVTPVITIMVGRRRRQR